MCVSSLPDKPLHQGLPGWCPLGAFSDGPKCSQQEQVPLPAADGGDPQPRALNSLLVLRVPRQLLFPSDHFPFSCQENKSPRTHPCHQVQGAQKCWHAIKTEFSLLNLPSLMPRNQKWTSIA